MRYLYIAFLLFSCSFTSLAKSKFVLGAELFAGGASFESGDVFSRQTMTGVGTGFKFAFDTKRLRFGFGLRFTEFLGNANTTWSRDPISLNERFFNPNFFLDVKFIEGRNVYGFVGGEMGVTAATGSIFDAAIMATSGLQLGAGFKLGKRLQLTVSECWVPMTGSYTNLIGNASSDRVTVNALMTRVTLMLVPPKPGRK